MTPHDKLSSSSYCLAHPGREYLVYAPAGGEIAVDLSAAAGPFRVEWIHPESGKTTVGADVSGGGKVLLKAPFDGACLIHLRQKGESMNRGSDTSPGLIRRTFKAAPATVDIRSSAITCFGLKAHKSWQAGIAPDLVAPARPYRVKS